MDYKERIAPKKNVSAAAATAADYGWNGAKPLEAISTTKAKTSLDGVKLTGKSTIQMEVGMTVLIGDFELQMGYRKASGGTVPFSDYGMKTPVTISYLNGGVAPFYINAKNTIEIYKYAPATYRYKRNEVEIVQYVFIEDLPIRYIDLATLIIGGTRFPTVNYYPAIQYESGGSYIDALSLRNLYGASSVGWEGRIQNSSLRANELNSGTSIAKTDYGAILY